MGDPQGLLVGIGLGEAAREERTRGRDTVELQRRFGTLIPHKPGVNEAAHADDSNRIGFGR